MLAPQASLTRRPFKPSRPAERDSSDPHVMPFSRTGSAAHVRYSFAVAAVADGQSVRWPIKSVRDELE